VRREIFGNSALLLKNATLKASNQATSFHCLHSNRRSYDISGCLFRRRKTIQTAQIILSSHHPKETDAELLKEIQAMAREPALARYTKND